MNLNSTWATLEESFAILGDYGYPAMDKAADELKLSPDYFTWIAAIWLFGSTNFTTADFMRMFPYGLARVNEEIFASAAHKGYLVPNASGGYTYSEKGLDIALKLWRAAGDSLADLKAISEERLGRLFSYFDRLIEAMLTAPEPPPHYYIFHKRDNYVRLGTERLLEDFVVRFGLLSAYRDNAHIASWQALGVDGHAWDMFTRLWHSASPASAKQLFEKVAYRGIPIEMVVQVLQNLLERGWVESNESVYQLTAKGKQIRDEAEALTDQYFFAPWSCLNESELEELSSLASQLRDGLKK